MQNKITAAQYSFTVTPKNRPFSNNFVQMTGEVQMYKGAPEVHAAVECTANSNEPGRVYKCIFTPTGKLLECWTLN